MVVPGDGEEGVVLLPESEAHLVVFVVVGLTVPPVEPGQYQYADLMNMNMHTLELQKTHVGDGMDYN